MKDYYRILNVSETASEEQIKKAYRRLAKECHPDAAGDDPQKEQRMYELQEAYEILGDPEKKKAYDSKRNSFSEKKQAKKQEDFPGCGKPAARISRTQSLRLHPHCSIRG